MSFSSRVKVFDEKIVSGQEKDKVIIDQIVRTESLQKKDKIDSDIDKANKNQPAKEDEDDDFKDLKVRHATMAVTHPAQ